MAKTKAQPGIQLKKKDDGKKRKKNPQRMIMALPGNLELWEVDIDDLREQRVNAHVTPPEIFEKLTRNIAARGAPESIPFVVKREKKNGRQMFDIISGHHRTRAIRAAGLSKLIVLADTRDLTRSQIVAKQIAHNALVGKDDPQVLAEMLREIDNALDMIEAAVDPAEFGLNFEPPSFEVAPINVDFEYRWATVMFLPLQLKKLDEVVEKLRGDEALVGACDREVYERFKEAVRAVNDQCDIRNLGAVLAKMCDITMEYLDKQAKQQEESENGEEKD